MKTKLCIAIILLLINFLNLKSQAAIASSSVQNQIEISVNSYSDDFMIGKTHFTLVCKPAYVSDILNYRFELQADNHLSLFEMANIEPGEKSKSIVLSELITSLNEISSDYMIDEDRIAKILGESDLQKLTDDDKKFLHDVKLGGFVKDNAQLRNQLNLLKPKIQANLDSLTLLTDTSKNARILLTLNQFANGFITKAYLHLLLKVDTGDEIGTLSVNKKVKLYSIKLEDEKAVQKALEYKYNKLLAAPKGSGWKEKILGLRPKMNFRYQEYLLRNIIQHRDGVFDNILNRDKNGVDSLIVEQVEIKFESEQIVSIKVKGMVNKRHLDFLNTIPQSYSTKADVTNGNPDKKNQYKRLYSTNDTNFILIDEALKDDYRLVNLAENYSPADQVITLAPGINKVIRKESLSTIINAAIFTDAMGLNSSQPNGLIQTEISHRFYLNRKTMPLVSNKRCFNYWGFFESFRPKVIFSKLESNKKDLELGLLKYNGNNILYLKAIDILRQSSWSSGIDLDIIFLGVPTIHSMFYFDLGAYIYTVPLKLPQLDSSALKLFHDINYDSDMKFNKTFITLFPEVYWVINPHPRFQLANSLRYLTIFNGSEDFKIVSDLNRFQKNGTAKGTAGIVNYKFMASMRLSDKANGTIFFRSLYSFVLSAPSLNYFQAQLGYSFDIFGSKVPPPVKPFDRLQ